MKLWQRGIIIGLVLSLLLGAVGTAGAANPPRRRRALVGRVLAVEEDALLLRTRQGEVQVLTTPETRFWVRGVEQPTLNDVQVGSLVLVRGQRDEEGNLVARLVAVIPPRLVRRIARSRGIRGIGRVIAIEGDTLLLQTRRGEVRVLTTAETRFRVRGVEQPTLNDVQVGDIVLVLGHHDEEGNLVARLVAVVPIRQRQPREGLSHCRGNKMRRT